MNELDVFHTSYNADYVKEASALQGPYLFRDYDHWHLFTESAIKDEINAKIEEAMGCHIVETNHFGFREVVSTVKATTPEEFASVKMRVVNVSPYPEAAVILGATGTPLGIGDVYMSLQTSVVQATENPLSACAGFAVAVMLAWREKSLVQVAAAACGAVLLVQMLLQ